MIFTSENNWYYYSYNNLEPFSRQTNNLKFKTHFSKYKGHIGNFKEELCNAAKSIINFYPSLTPNIFLSGGVDSEVVLRSFLNIGITPKVTIIRYENDYNLYDVSFAVVICNMLGINYKIIDLNLKKFYENEALKISDLAQIDRPRALPQCKFLEFTDDTDLAIMGLGDLSLNRLNDDYNKKGLWVNRCWEFEIGYDKYVRKVNRPAIFQFFKWTPGLVISFLNLEWCKNLVNDKYYGKLGIHSTKILGYKEFYPDLFQRKKQTGFEKIDNLINEVELCLKKKYNGLPFRNYVDRTIDDVYKEILKY